MTDYDPRIVDLYDDENPDGPDHDRFRSLADARGARAIVDLGCGTGILTVTLAVDGRRVVGVDPSPAMLAFARAREGGDRVEWVEGDSTRVPQGLFDLAIMSGNVAQHIPDPDWTRTLTDLRERMAPGGTLVFESRNPAARAWEEWASDRATRQTRHGALVEWADVERVDDRTVRLSAHTVFARTGDTVAETLELVFRSRDEIERDLVAAGFEVESVDGDWAGTPFDGSERIMVVVARAC